MSNLHTKRTSVLSQATLLSLSLSTATSLVLLQLLTRAVTFILNQALVRIAPPEVFGTASVQLDLVLSTILFLSREGVRNTLLRSTDQGRQAQQSANLSLLPIYAGLPLSLLTSMVYYSLTSSTTRTQSHFTLAVALYALGAFLVLLAEPWHVRAVNELRMGARVRAEGVGVVSQSVATFSMMLLGGAEWALAAFAVGKVMYGIVLCLVYIWEFRSDSPFYSLFPKKTVEKVHENTMTTYFDPHLLRLSMAMSAQGVVKHFLTEGDSLILSRFSSLKDQGGYALANNYGSLVARIVFLPMEETSRLFFSKTLSAPDALPSSPDPSSSNPAPYPQPLTALQAAADVLSSLMLCDTHLLLFFLSLGHPLASTLLTYLLPKRYLATSAPRVLTGYCLYLPTMAFNGILEAFFASTAEQADLRRQSWALLLFSATFLCAALGLMRTLELGELGLVYANTLNLGLRAAYSWVYIRQYFTARGQAGLVSLKRASPPWVVWTTFLLAGALLRVSERRKEASLSGDLTHLGLGVACGLVCLGVWSVFPSLTLTEC
ncbi:Rft-1-domain-containing protein [Dacryopinax primogenitus]|uniref:Man(5)GlcNAc(2)-PP-dolichol translocation protein RFT1 n=1 Tax=Dacryopinax primogenitus (strain DJM 731) TaxID=1858805 RepID=M5FX20_DACPD|nr:Rft-1-domain-containing protein [Dacryopinax primogenitus]EJU00255.1 Rft-1-domain-containing protein [Dacryopinax primogenitus]